MKGCVHAPFATTAANFLRKNLPPAYANATQATGRSTYEHARGGISANTDPQVGPPEAESRCAGVRTDADHVHGRADPLRSRQVRERADERLDQVPRNAVQRHPPRHR